MLEQFHLKVGDGAITDERKSVCVEMRGSGWVLSETECVLGIINFRIRKIKKGYSIQETSMQGKAALD